MLLFSENSALNIHIFNLGTSETLTAGSSLVRLLEIPVLLVQQWGKIAKFMSCGINALLTQHKYTMGVEYKTYDMTTVGLLYRYI